MVDTVDDHCTLSAVDLSAAEPSMIGSANVLMADTVELSVIGSANVPIVDVVGLSVVDSPMNFENPVPVVWPVEGHYCSTHVVPVRSRAAGLSETGSPTGHLVYL